MPSEAPHDAPLQTLSRGLDVLEAFDASRPSMSLSEVAEVTGMTRASARRVLLTLEHLGHVRCRDRRFSLAPRVLRLGWSYLASLDADELTGDLLADVAARTASACSLVVPDGDQVRIVAHAPISGAVELALSVGQRLPADAVAGGKVLATSNGLDAPRAPWVAVDGRLEAGVRTVAAPVGPPQRPTAAVQLTMPAVATGPPSPEALEALVTCAVALSALYTASPHPNVREDPCA